MAVPHATTAAAPAIKPSKISAKAAAAAAKLNAETVSAKQRAQMHRRSRTGCYTCRLRRKKCDEGSPLCTACKNLGLACEYKRPPWWSNNEARRNHKDEIKTSIKHKKLTEKATSASTTSAQPQSQSQSQSQQLHHHHHHSSTTTTIQTSVGSPPGLSHSLPTSASTFSDPLDRTRSASIDSHFSYNFNSPPTSSSDYGMAGAAAASTPGSGSGIAGTTSAFSTPQLHPEFMFGNGFAPYEVDIKTERQMYVNDVPTLRESSTSTFSTFHTPPPPGTVLPAYPYMDGSGGSSSSAAMCGEDAAGLGMHGVHGVPGAGGEWMQQMYSERRESMTEETLNMHFFDFSQGLPPTAAASHSRQVAVELDEADQRLLDHFVQFVLPTIFPVLESNQHGSVASDLILPALQNNKCYLHCCLSIAAQHVKTVLHNAGGAITAGVVDYDADIMKHRFATITELCNALSRDENHQQILDAALGLIFFQCCVGRFDDALPDVPWHQHFQAVASLVQKLNLPAIVTELPLSAVTAVASTSLPSPQSLHQHHHQHQHQLSSPPMHSSPPPHQSSSPQQQTPALLPSVPEEQQGQPPHPPLAPAAAGVAAAPVAVSPQTPFSMTLAAWIDILGATMLGRAPTFAHTYREKHLSPPHATSLGLRELMGCEDRVMYLISEIACLEALKAGGMEDITLCQHVSVLGDQIGLTEMGEAPARLPFNANGSLSPKQLSKNVTAAFRLAARIYLCSLVPGFYPAQSSCVALVDKLTAVLHTIPCGPAGFDRCMVWVYLMGGAMSLPCTAFRELFADRIQQMGDMAFVGSFGRAVSLLHEVWQRQDQLEQPMPVQQTAVDPATGVVGTVASDVAMQLSDSGSPMPGGQLYIHWRDVMQAHGWEFLLI